jgi:transcriptional regulator with XRE-family HTH domain
VYIESHFYFCAFERRASAPIHTDMTKDLQRILGKAARNARMALGLTQAQMADLLDLNAEFYGRIERGTAWPSVTVFARMVPVLGVSANTLLGLDGLDIERAPESVPLTRPDESPELRELVAYVRNAGPEVVRLVSNLVRDLERVHAAGTSTSTRGNAVRESADTRDEDSENTLC